VLHKPFALDDLYAALKTPTRDARSVATADVEPDPDEEP
jgi:hypothetical protein